MPSPLEDKKALDWVSQNQNDPRAKDVMQKLGVNPIDVEAWKYSNSIPDDPRSMDIRNKIFTNIAQKRPAENVQGVGIGERMAVKNLLDNEPKAQELYLQKKGYETRNVDGKIQVKRPGETSFKVIDPEGIGFWDALKNADITRLDIWDATDLIGDIGESLAGGLATGAKIAGAVGAPETGGSSLIAGSIGGGLVTGGFEAARQRFGQALGVREEINQDKINQAMLMGAAFPGITKAAGKILGVGAKGVQKGLKFFGQKAQPNSKEIIAAAKELGAKATPGQLIDSKLVRDIESAQYKRVGTIGGSFLRRQINKNKTAAENAAEAITSAAGTSTKFEAGEQFGKRITKEVSENLLPAETIYQKYDNLFQNTPIPPQKIEAIKSRINEIAKSTLDPEATRYLAGANQMLDRIDNLDQLKQFRSIIGQNIGGTNNRLVKKSLGQVYESITNARRETLISAADQAGGDIAEVAFEEIKLADDIYREVANDLGSTIFKGKTIRGGLKGALKDYLEKNPEISRIDRVLATNDPAKIAAVKEAFPYSFESLRAAKVADIVARSSKGGRVNPKKLSKIITNLPDETASLLFEKDQVNKAKALDMFLNNLPDDVNPSNTAFAKNMLSVLEQLRAMRDSTVSSVVSRSLDSRDVISKMSQMLQSNTAASASIFTGRQLLPQTEEPPGLRLPDGRKFSTPSLGGR